MKKFYEHMGKEFTVEKMNETDKWICRVTGWLYEDSIESESEAITIAEDYIEQNYHRIK